MWIKEKQLKGNPVVMVIMRWTLTILLLLHPYNLSRVFTGKHKDKAKLDDDINSGIDISSYVAAAGKTQL